MRKIVYEGYTIIQTENNHITIYQNDEMIFHANCNRKLTDEELKEQIIYVIILTEEIQEIEKIERGCDVSGSNYNTNN